VKNIHFFGVALAPLLLFLLAAGCSQVVLEAPKKEPLLINSIGVLPVQPAAVAVLEADAATRQQLEDGATVIDFLLGDYFQGRDNIHFIEPDTLEDLQAYESGDSLRLALAAGLQLQYDAVLVTEVARYQTRTGSKFAADKPASVAFSFKLLAMANGGQVIWSGEFDQAQQPLFENILGSRSTGSGFRWLTAPELAAAGLTKKLNSSPYLGRH
jgi:hypothetical protein